MLQFEHAKVNLEHTLFCGQTFRWKRGENGLYFGNVEGKAVAAETQDNALLLHGAEVSDRAFWARYFDLGRNYASLLCATDEHLSYALALYPGLKVLRQPFFETLCSFILSSNNNIKRITGLVDRFSAIGEEDENGLHAFPTPQQVVDAGEDRLRSIGAGYRADYLWQAALRMADGFDYASLSALPYEQAAEALRIFRGVGEKVADCVLLFACNQNRAFPVDTWMEKILTQWYGFSGSRSALKQQAIAHFGDCSGIAQQFLFLYAISKKAEFR